MVVISVGDAIRLTYLPVAAASSSLKFCLHSTEETSFRFGCFTETTIFPRRRRRSLYRWRREANEILFVLA